MWHAQYNQHLNTRQYCHTATDGKIGYGFRTVYIAKKCTCVKYTWITTGELQLYCLLKLSMLLDLAVVAVLHHTPSVPYGRTGNIEIRLMLHLQFYRATLSINFITWQNRSMQLCMSHTATLLHKQDLINQPSPHFATKWHRTEWYSIRKKSCATVEKLHNMPCHTCDFVARQRNGGYVYWKCVEISLKFRRKLLFVNDCIAVVLFNKSGITLH